MSTHPGFSHLITHLVFSTKNREPIIYKATRAELYSQLGTIVQAEEAVLLGIGGAVDHVHLVVKVNPTHALTELIRRVKVRSAKWVNDYRKIPGFFAWQEGYAAFSVSQSQVGALLAFVAQQDAFHGGKSFEEEYLQLLDKHGIGRDADTLWV